LQEIRNQGNPGGFDFKRYCLFQGITGQVFLQQNDYILLNDVNTSFYQRLFFPAREAVLNIIKTNIKGSKEAGLAEALLVGYKNDLDKSLIQSYSNTGVVHVVAISGLHIGLIYWVLMLLLKPLKKFKAALWLQPLLIITGLWLFSLLAGGQPSVLRSAVMFTCIVVGQSFQRHGHVYNTLAFSAFILLCHNPYWLWDVGFQLSYAAVLSIIIFMKPIYNWFYVKNKILDLLWQLNAVTLAAQILTLPLTIFYFHQFPNYFILANVVAVPLSSIIVLGEILLCAVSFFSYPSAILGSLLEWMIRQMNLYISTVESLPGSLWDGLHMGLGQAIILIIFIAGMGCWLMEKSKYGFFISVVSVIAFLILGKWHGRQVAFQQKIIVYNIPGHRAIDFVSGSKYFFWGDTALEAKDFLRNFHLRPARVESQAKAASSLEALQLSHNYGQFAGLKILFINRYISYTGIRSNPGFDLIIVSNNPKLYIKQLASAVRFKQMVFDSSVPSWRLKYWKKDCDSLAIPYHDVSEKGAFVMRVN
jgi:competence protein ComEC